MVAFSDVDVSAGSEGVASSTPGYSNLSLSATWFIFCHPCLDPRRP